VDIVIAGGGKIGETLCQELSKEDINIVLLEKNQNRLEQIINKTDITGLTGDATDYDSLVEAGIQNCDLFIAVTPEDETNIISSVIAKKLGAAHTIARVRNPKYANRTEFIRDSLGISMVINPELEAAKLMARLLEFPESLSTETFEKGRVNIVEVRIQADSLLAGISLTQFGQRYSELLICAVTHRHETFIPSGDTVLYEGDHLYVTGEKEELNHFYREVGYKNKEIPSSLIIGGGRVTYYLLQRLSKLDMDIKVIEMDYDTAVDLSHQFPDMMIIRGDGTDQEFLNEERIEQFDAVLSLTGIDEENIINSLYAISLDVNKVITKVSRTGLLKILEDTDLQSIVTPKILITSKILKFVRSLRGAKASNVEALYRIADNKVEALQFLVKKGSQVIGKTFNELNIKENVLVAYIIRGKELIFPSGEDRIYAGDHVIVVTTYKRFDDIDDILK